MGITYKNLHKGKYTWLYEDVFNVGLFFEDYKSQLSEDNIASAKKTLISCRDSFSFDPVTLTFGKAKLIVSNVDQACTTIDELELLEKII